MGFIASAKAEGAQLLTGGGKPADPSLATGLFIAPTVFDKVTPAMRIGREEIFGPVMSVMTWDNQGVRIADPEQVVLEAEPYRRLSYTWHTFTPELATAIHLDQETFRQAATEPRSKVTFDIEPAGERVKLTVVHDGFEPGSAVLESVSTGWPQVLSGLKTLLESGAPLPA